MKVVPGNCDEADLGRLHTSARLCTLKGTVRTRDHKQTRCRRRRREFQSLWRMSDKETASKSKFWHEVARKTESPKGQDSFLSLECRERVELVKRRNCADGRKGQRKKLDGRVCQEGELWVKVNTGGTAQVTAACTGV